MTISEDRGSDRSTGQSVRVADSQWAEHFRQRGYVVRRQLLTPAQVSKLIGHMDRCSDQADDRLQQSSTLRWALRRRLPSGWTLPDGVTKHPEFWPVIFEPGLLEAVRGLLGPSVRFLQHTDLHVGYSSFNWHRDSVSREYGAGADWDGHDDYGIVRVGIYLRVPNARPEHEAARAEATGATPTTTTGRAVNADSRFRLGLIPGTHRPPAPGGERERRKVERHTGWMSHLYRWALGENAVPPGTEWVKPEPGDAVIFDPRVIHTGTPVTGPKYSLFLAYGLPNRHSTNHVHYYRHLRPELNYQEIPQDLAERLKGAGLYFDPDPPDEVPGATTENRLLSWLARAAGVR